MKQFLSVKDIPNPIDFALKSIELKADPFKDKELGKNKSLGLIFLNPSLRTRMSSQKAAMNLGLDTMVLNMDQEGWALETQDGVIMDGTKVEHIRDAAGIMGQYCDILALRSFANLVSKEADYRQEMLNGLIQYSGVPVVSLESALTHPLQSLADLITILEQGKITGKAKPKITLLWAPHIKALPQAVPNSFAEWMLKSHFDLTIGAPKGFELDPQFTKGAHYVHTKGEAIKNADFIYVKNWSSFQDYGKVGTGLSDWLLKKEDLDTMNPGAKIMHCLPVRRDLELDSALLDSPYSLTLQQGENRIYSAQMVLKTMLLELSKKA